MSIVFSICIINAKCAAVENEKSELFGNYGYDEKLPQGSYIFR